MIGWTKFFNKHLMLKMYVKTVKSVKIVGIIIFLNANEND
jgi:hypothetical protein